MHLKTTLLGFTLWGLCGCASLQEEPLSIPHGIAIQHSEIPAQLLEKLQLPEDTKVERYGSDPEDASYRIEYEDGSILLFGPDGTPRGGII